MVYNRKSSSGHDGSRDCDKKNEGSSFAKKPFRASGDRRSSTDPRPSRDRSDRYGSDPRPSRDRSDRYGSDPRPSRDRSDRYGSDPRPSRDRSEASNRNRTIRSQKGWGSLSRKGALKAVDFKDNLDRTDVQHGGSRNDREPFVPDGFVQVDETKEKSKPSRNGRKFLARQEIVADLLEKEVSLPLTPSKRAKAERLLSTAVDAYERSRYPESKRILEELLILVPDSLSAQELYGLTLYRMGMWAPAIKVLERFNSSSGSFDQLPVLADCYRAQSRYQDVDRIWSELAAASPSPELIGEGRIVVAGAAADQKDFPKAISILERSLAIKRKPTLSDLRQWYFLADLYERAGEIGHSRALFAKILKHDAKFLDAAERLADLG